MVPKISIIVPIYKTEKYIARCLESLVNQTFRDIEIICINDGSPDNSPAICEEYAKKDDRIIILSQTNQGLSAARNTGLLHARGKYIQFCDSDDFFDLTMCEKMYNIISTTNADIAVSDVNVVYDGISFWGDESYFRVPFRGISTITDATFKQINVFAWNKIYKKDLLDKFNITFPYGLYYEDAGFLFKYLMVSKTICCINDPLYNYICRADSIMEETCNNRPDYAIDHIYVIQDVACFLEIHGFNKKHVQAFIWMVLAYTGLSCIYGGEKVYSKAFETGSTMLKNIDFNSLMTETHNRDDVLRLYALKKCNTDMYFSVDRYNKEHERIKNEYELTKEENQKLWEQLNDLLKTQAQIFDKRFQDGLFIPTLRSYVLFPWYIYRIFCMVYNNTPPKCNIRLIFKAYLFFPYYVLKIYFTLLMRSNSDV
jgi:glycosyltransferase involved in cell wall biosynthesis